MIYAQIKSGRKLHLACEPGEEHRGEVVRAGYLSRPICGQPMEGNYRMTINMPLGHSCKKCQAARRARSSIATVEATYEVRRIELEYCDGQHEGYGGDVVR